MQALNIFKKFSIHNGSSMKTTIDSIFGYVVQDCAEFRGSSYAL